MEEEAPSRRSVAELAGKFKGSAPPLDTAGNETDKPVRRRPPLSLQLNQEPPGVTSPLPVKTKRNSALIEKLQASLSHPPSGQLPSPKSPGFGLLLPAFPPASPSSAIVTMETTSSMGSPTSPVTTSPVTEEEGPASFEDPPTVAEGSILLSINKSRARHSIRRRPPSRRHRKSSSGDEVGASNNVVDKTTTEEGGVEKEETDEVTKDKTDASTCPGEDQPKGGEERGRSSSEGNEEEEEAQERNSGENQREDASEGATNTENKEEEEKSTVTPS